MSNVALGIAVLDEVERIGAPLLEAEAPTAGAASLDEDFDSTPAPSHPRGSQATPVHARPDGFCANGCDQAADELFSHLMDSMSPLF